MLIVKLAMLYEGVFALKRWLLLQHLLRVWGGQFHPECPGQFRPEWVVSLRRNGVVTFIRISNESLGTQKYIGLLGVILEALIERKMIWIDELDSRFHEHLLKMIIGLFNSKENNPNGAQLICTCHNTSLLKKSLRRDQMVFAERDETGATSITSLYYKDPAVRNDASFDKDYSSGKYGAVPKLEQMNLFSGLDNDDV